MTLNVLTQVPEGLVMLTDSMVSSQQTIDGEREHVNFQHARKLFHLGETPAAAMLNGDANIGPSMVSQLLRDASGDVNAHKGPIDHQVCLDVIAGRISPVYDKFVAQSREQIAKQITADPVALAKINKTRKKAGHSPLSAITPDMIAVSGITQKRQPAPVTEIVPPEFMVIIGSYFASPLASLLIWPGAAQRDLVSGPGNGLWWWGSGGVPLTRLIKGVDFDLLISDGGARDPAPASARKYFEEHEDRYTMRTALELMPVQQAIYFTEYLATVAAGYDRFKVGPHTVGGEIDVIALVDGRLKWIHKQRLMSSLDGPTNPNSY